MRSPDFLHKEAETKLCGYFVAAGAPCRLLTNSEAILESARETFLPLESPLGPIAFSVRFWVDETTPSQPPWPRPYVRGSSHLIFAGFDEVSSVLTNLRSRQIIGRFSPAMAADRSYYKSVIFPMLLTIVSATVGIAELHCASVAKNEDAVLLVGQAGAGKSTLSLALSQAGFGFMSDDRTFCSHENDEVYVWGLPTRVKLRADARRWFPELKALHTSDIRNGGAEVWLEPRTVRGIRCTQRARASTLIFLERTDTREFCLSPLSSTKALNRLTLDLLPELPDATAKRSETIARMLQRPSWLLRYGGPPQWIASQIAKHLQDPELAGHRVCEQSAAVGEEAP